MRIISGTAGRMRIRVPKRVTRPTTDFIRQALFSILGERVQNAVVADLFAGSGALGLEALSRGAKFCHFVDNNSSAVRVIEENLHHCKFENGSVHCSDASSWISRQKMQFDLIFTDPPYAKNETANALAILSSHSNRGDVGSIKKIFSISEIHLKLNPGGLWLIEQAAESGAPQTAPGLELLDRREYGSSAILIYRRSMIN